MGVWVESRWQNDLPQAPPGLDGDRLCGSSDQREGGGGRGARLLAARHPAGSRFNRLQLPVFYLFFVFLFQLCLHPHRGQGHLNFLHLPPPIAAAVAEALKASSRPVSRPKVPSKAVEEPNYGPGKYNFVNPAGALVTVNYEAGVNGFSQTRDVKQGAVQMRNIPGAWTGPLAGVDEVNSVPATSSSTRGLSSTSSSSAASQEALIAQILTSIQPKITSAVQSAISAPAQNNRRTVVQAPRQAVRVAAPRPIAPRPIAPRPRPGVIAPSRRVATSTSTSGLSDVFGNGETSVKFATPQFQFEF